MARKYRKRDVDGSKLRMVAAIGTILREKGHRFLFVNEIARQAEVGKQYIKKYFGGLSALIKVYLYQKEYWLPRFEQVRAHGLPREEELLQFYTETLQDQFRFFTDTKELQKFILWQISEPNAIMRSVSEAREKEGARLLALAHTHFKDSDINFNAVVALILGGSYYVGLHATTKNSPVCGIDVNEERDKEIFIRTMGQILELIWKAADEKKPQ